MPAAKRPPKTTVVRKRADWKWVSSLVAAVVVVFGVTVTHDFVSWDDLRHLEENEGLWPPASRDLSGFWTKPYWGLYVPVAYTWFGLLGAVSENLSPAGRPVLYPAIFHVANLVLHAVCAVQTFVILRRLGGSAGAAFVGGLLFAVHPLQAESVAWVSEGRGLLSAAFALTAVACYLSAVPLRIVGEEIGPDVPASRRRGFYAAALLATVAALLSKPSAVALPLILVVLERCAVRPAGLKAVLLRTAPFFAIAAIVVVITKLQQPAEQLRETVPLWQRPIVAADAITFYLVKLVLPFHLAIDYGRTPGRALADPLIWLTASAPLVALGLLIRYGKREAWCAAGLFLAPLAPVLGLIPFGYQDISTVADRYAYLALLGPAFALTAFAARPTLTGAERTTIGAAAAILSVLCFLQTLTWKDDSTLFPATLRVNPRSTVALFNSARHEQKSGNLQAAGLLYRQVLTIEPQNAEAMLELCNLACESGDPKTALEWGAQAVAADPNSSGAFSNYGVALAMAGDLVGAERQFRQALALGPKFETGVKLNLARCLAARNQLVEAEQVCRAAVERRPDYEPARQLLAQLQADLAKRRP